MENKRSLHKILDDGEVVLSKRGVIIGLILLPVYLVGLSFVLSFAVVFLETKFGIVISDLYFNLIYYIIMMVIVLAVFGKYLWASFKRALTQKPRYVWIAALYLGLLGTYAFNMVAQVVIGVCTNDLTSVNEDSATAYAEQSPLLMIFMACICAPIIEEVFFRGVLFRPMAGKKCAWIAYLVSGLLFAAIHVVPATIANGDLMELIYLVSYLPMGIIFAVCCHKTKNIFGSILLHFANNLIAVVLPLVMG